MHFLQNLTFVGNPYFAVLDSPGVWNSAKLIIRVFGKVAIAQIY
jgi:hypothetical protein